MTNIDKYLITEKKLPKAVQKFIKYVMDYGYTKREIDRIINRNKSLADAVDEIYELVQDDVSPGDFDEIDSLKDAAWSSTN